MEIKELKDNLTRDLTSLGYKLYDLNFTKADNCLHVIIDKTMDLKEIESLSEKISAIMDLYDSEMDPYLLDVSSIGIERPITNEEELKEAIGSYIFIKTKDLKICGDLKAYDNGILSLIVKEKNISKELKINYQDIKKMRYAVKF